jgi:hypothetical protein
VSEQRRDEEGRFTRDESGDVNALIRSARGERVGVQGASKHEDLNEFIRRRGRPEQRDEQRDTGQGERTSSGTVSDEERLRQLEQENRDLHVRALAEKVGMRSDATPAAVALLDWTAVDVTTATPSRPRCEIS